VLEGFGERTPVRDDWDESAIERAIPKSIPPSTSIEKDPDK
jgi:hypothetical protein